MECQQGCFEKWLQVNSSKQPYVHEDEKRKGIYKPTTYNGCEENWIVTMEKYQLHDIEWEKGFMFIRLANL